MAGAFASLGACALLVGDPDGHRQLGDTPGDSSSSSSVSDAGPDTMPDRGDTDADADSQVDADAAPKDAGDAGFGGRPIAIANGQTPAGIVATGEGIYWSNSGDSTIRRLPRPDGGGLPLTTGMTTVVNVADSGAQSATDLLVDTNNILYALVGPPAVPQSTCRTFVDFTVPSGSGVTCAKPTNVCSSSTSIASRLAVDTTNVYMSNGDCKYILYEARPGNNANGWKQFGSLSAQSSALASDSTNLYYAFDREIDAQLLATGSLPDPTPFALSHTAIVDLVVDGTAVYWIDLGGDVETLGKAQAGEPPMVLATGQASPVRMAFDDTNLYWTNSGGNVPGTGSVMMVPKRGGTPVVLASGQSSPGAITVDSLALYWTTSTAIMELVR
jgi:hypothetical protein